MGQPQTSDTCHKLCVFFSFSYSGLEIVLSDLFEVLFPVSIGGMGMRSSWLSPPGHHLNPCIQIKRVIADRPSRPLVCGPALAVHYPSQSFLFCFRFILPVMSCPNEMLIFTEISFLLMFAVTTYLLPSCLEISALWMSGLSSTIFFLSMCENTMNAFIGRFMWFGECFFVWN